MTRTKITDPFWAQVDQYVIDEQRKKLDPDMVKFLEGVYGCVEADSYASHMLWHENHYKPDGRPPLAWETINPGWTDCVGTVGEHQVWISLFKVKVEGKLLLFYHGMSRVVDHDLIRAWLDKYIPESGRHHSDGRVNNVDANNFHNVFRKR